jgi:predicted MFS family arabinose efflux permease
MVSGFALRRHLNPTLVALPAAMAVLALALIGLGTIPWLTAALLIAWGFFANPIPVAWNTWMSRTIPDELEAGGGLQVALIQFAITFGAFAGGLLFDTMGWSSPFMLGAALLAISALLAVAAIRGRT